MVLLKCRRVRDRLLLGCYCPLPWLRSILKCVWVNLPGRVMGRLSVYWLLLCYRLLGGLSLALLGSCRLVLRLNRAMRMGRLLRMGTLVRLLRVARMRLLVIGLMGWRVLMNRVGLSLVMLLLRMMRGIRVRLIGVGSRLLLVVLMLICARLRKRRR